MGHSTEVMLGRKARAGNPNDQLLDVVYGKFGLHVCWLEGKGSFDMFLLRKKEQIQICQLL